MPSDTVTAVVIVLGLAGLFLGVFTIVEEYVEPGTQTGEHGTAHAHLRFAAVLNGDEIDFTQPEYVGRARRAHFHGGNNVLHIHAEDVTAGFTFRAIGLEIDDGCMTTNGTQYCNNQTHEFRFYANGEVISSYQSYKPEQADSLMLWYGEKDAEPDMGFFDGELPPELQEERRGRRL